MHCQSAAGAVGLRLEDISFDQVPHQTRLFTDYLRRPSALLKYYPTAVDHHHDRELIERSSQVLGRYAIDRATLCDVLMEMNEKWGASQPTFENILRLRNKQTVAVMSGQQAGLFGGPLYTIYKALSAVKLARCLLDRGIGAVPVFWIASEDHDFAEVATTSVIGCDCRLANISVSANMHTQWSPVGSVLFDDSITRVIAELFQALPASEFAPDLRKVVEESYRPGQKYTDAFAQLVQALIGEYGLILIDPLNPTLKRLAAPIYKQAIEKAPEIAASLEARSRQLEADGYHAQTLVTRDSFPLFLHIDGKRHALTQTGKEVYRCKHAEETPSDAPTEFDLKTLAQMADSSPESFSPNVTLRAVVQDFLLPTIAYYGGGAEIAYFAQSSETYRVLNRPITTIFHRASMTIVEHSIARTFERYNLSLTDLFDGMEKVVARVVEEHLDVATSKSFNETEEQIGLALNKLRDNLGEFDPTLAEALESGRRKINYQIDGLRARFQRALVGRNEAASRQIERAFASLYPNKSLQERQLNITSLVARHGRYVINWLYDAIDIETTNKHRLVFL